MAIHSPQYATLGVLTRRLLGEVEATETHSILRRSAAIPHFFSAIMRAEAGGGECALSSEIMSRLVRILHAASFEAGTPALIHALNVLRFLVQDSQLRSATQPHLAQLLRFSLQGFAAPDWSVRNSALMLYTALAKKTILPKDVATGCASDFFRSFPSLLPFFIEQLRGFAGAAEEKSFSSVVPICLLLGQMVAEQTAPEGKLAVLAALLRGGFNNRDYFVRRLLGKGLIALMPVATLPAELIPRSLDEPHRAHTQLMALRFWVERCVARDSAQPWSLTLSPLSEDVIVDLRSVEEELRPMCDGVQERVAAPLKAELLRLYSLFCAAGCELPPSMYALVDEAIERLATKGVERPNPDLGDSHLTRVSLDLAAFTATDRESLFTRLIFAVSPFEGCDLTERILQLAVEFKVRLPAQSLLRLLRLIAESKAPNPLTVSLLQLHIAVASPQSDDVLPLLELCRALRSAHQNHDRALPQLLQLLAKLLPVAVEGQWGRKVIDEHLSLMQAMSQPEAKDVHRLAAAEQIKATCAVWRQTAALNFEATIAYSVIEITLVQDESMRVREQVCHAAFGHLEAVPNENESLRLLVHRLMEMPVSKVPGFDLGPWCAAAQPLLLGHLNPGAEARGGVRLFKAERVNKFREDELVKHYALMSFAELVARADYQEAIFVHGFAWLLQNVHLRVSRHEEVPELILWAEERHRAAATQRIAYDEISRAYKSFMSRKR